MSAVDAAVTAATSIGVSCTDPVVLHNSSNVVVHLRPAAVVARVATLTALVRPGVAAWFRRDAAVAAHAAAHGVLTSRPLEVLSVDGFVVGLWQYEPHDPSYVVSPGEVAARLFDLHVALADVGFDLPPLAPCLDVSRALPLAPSAARPVLEAENDRLRAALSQFPWRPLHGDSHPGNLLATPAGLMWNDFEDTWLGPLGWDLACLATSSRVDGEAAVAAYPGACAAEELAVCVALRELLVVVWQFVLASRFPHRRAQAEDHLARWLAAR
jgi:hypothetical protein